MSFFNRLQVAIKTGFFDSVDYNGQESGVYTGPLLDNWEVGDKVIVAAEPSSRRECLDGEITIRVLSVSGEYFKISLEDKMGRIGGYPDFETYYSDDGTPEDFLVNSDTGEFWVNP